MTTVFTENTAAYFTLLEGLDMHAHAQKNAFTLAVKC